MNGSPDTHSKLLGYLLWLFGFTGSHRFYYGKPVSGTIWFVTFGLFLIGWLIDLFLIPSLDRAADRRFVAGPINYSVAWILLTFLGVLNEAAARRGKRRVWGLCMGWCDGSLLRRWFRGDWLTAGQQPCWRCDQPSTSITRPCI